MKALVIIFAIALCCCNTQSVPGGYTQVSAADIQNDANIQSLANFGAQAIVQQALKEGKLPNSNTNFKLTKINSVYQQVVSGINYKFDVTLTNSDNGVVINALFTIYYQAWTNTKQIISSSFQIPTYGLTSTPAQTQTQPQPTQTQAGGYTLVSASDVQNSAIIQSLAQLGAQNISQQAIAAKKVPANSKFSISKINSVYQQVVNGINYKFDVTLTSTTGTVINAQFVIYYQASTNTRSITSFSYNVAPLPVPAAQTTTPTTTTTPTSTTTTTVPTTATTTTTPSTQAGGWTLISATDVQNSQVIQSLAAFGAQDVAQKAIADKKAPANSKFTVSKINSVYSQVVNGINYKFNVNLVNADKSITLVAAYIVYYQSWTNTRKVLSSSYVVAP